MRQWIKQLQQILTTENKFVMVTVAQTKGSTPREVGAKLFVTNNEFYGTIGGGNLEYKAIKIARDSLQSKTSWIERKQFSLAAGLGMCCGGTVELVFELITTESQQWIDDCLTGGAEQKVLVTDLNASNPTKLLKSINQLPLNYSSDQQSLLYKINDQIVLIETLKERKPEIIIFGAGHVGQAMVSYLSPLAWKITWVDTRDDCLTDDAIDSLAPNINVCITDSPEAEIAQANSDSYFLVMTHDHGLDLELSEHILKRDDFCYFGLIGSRTKRKRFEHRLKIKGIDQQQINKIVCPIGIDGITSKQPEAIALSVAAQLMLHLEQTTHSQTEKQTEIQTEAETLNRVY